MGILVAQTHPSVSAFPESTVGSACTSSFSRIARRSLTLRPAHSRGHQIVTVIRRFQTFRPLHACSGRFRLERSPGGACTRWKSAALSRRTWSSDGDVAEPRHHGGEIVAPVETVFEFGEVAGHMLVTDGTVSASDGAFDVSEGSVDPLKGGRQGAAWRPDPEMIG